MRPLFLLHVPIGSQDFACFFAEDTWVRSGNCTGCGLGYPVCRKVPSILKNDGGRVGDFVNAVECDLVRRSVADALIARYPCCSVQPIVASGRKLPRGEELFELVVERVIYAAEVSGSGYAYTLNCQICRRVTIEIAHRMEARDRVFRELLEQGNNFVDKTGYDDVVLKKCQVGNCSIFRIEYVVMCTEDFVDFCIEKDYSNIGFVKIGHIEE